MVFAVMMMMMVVAVMVVAVVGWVLAVTLIIVLPSIGCTVPARLRIGKLTTTTCLVVATIGFICQLNRELVLVLSLGTYPVAPGQVSSVAAQITC